MLEADELCRMMTQCSGIVDDRHTFSFEVTLELVKRKCMPILLYGLEYYLSLIHISEPTRPY